MKLLSNYFRMVTAPDWTIYQYRVDFSQEEDRTFVKRSWFREAVANNNKFKQGYLFDGSVLFSIHPIVQKNDILSLTILDRNTNDPIKITIRLTGEVKSGDQPYLQIFNILLRRVMEKLDLKLLGRKYYDPHAKVDFSFKKYFSKCEEVN